MPKPLPPPHRRPSARAPAAASSPTPRSVTGQSYLPFAVVENLTLHIASSRIEHFGFHQSNGGGARQMSTVPGGMPTLVLESRERETGLQTAADVVADPGREIRSPVAGTVIRGGSCILYCGTPAHYVVILPDARPRRPAPTSSRSSPRSTNPVPPTRRGPTSTSRGSTRPPRSGRPPAAGADVYAGS